MKRSAFKTIKHLGRCLAACLIVFSIIVGSLTAYAAGSRNLTSDYNGTEWVGNGGYRPYTEWYNADTAGIKRHQIVKAYVKAGEIIYFGSSVVMDDAVVVHRPDGSSDTSWNYDIVANGNGYIANRNEEIIGPEYTVKTTVYNSGGYTPFSIKSDITGVWEFEFHSSADTNSNPNTKRVDYEWAQGDSTVAAWDLTVVDEKRDNPEVTGRVFATYLSLSMGSNVNAKGILNSSVYVLTKDGYVYKTDFNGMDPFGFVFFANNRGLVSLENNTSLYHSVRNPEDNNDFADLSNITKEYGGVTVNDGVGFHSPVQEDTPLDWTYKIFFEEPADDLPEDIKPTAYAPESVGNFRFVGYDENRGYVGAGGYFKFFVTRASSYQIKIDMNGFENPNNPNEDKSGGIVYIANACTEGENSAYWNGKDANGYDLPADSYGADGSSDIKISIDVKSGEYHFPIFDAENNYEGVKIELLTVPITVVRDANDDIVYDANGKVMYEPMALSDEQRRLVYYDNSKVKNSGINSYSYTPVDNTGVPYKDEENNTISFGPNQLEGMDSGYGASAYRNKVGDYCVLDIWTYFGGNIESVSASLNEFVLEEPQDKGKMTGFVFFDEDADGAYDIQKGDYSLGDITVTLMSEDGNDIIATTTTDLQGFYSFENLDYSTYTVKVSYPGSEEIFECTTANNEQAVGITDLNAKADDVGFTFRENAALKKDITVEKEWLVPFGSIDSKRPEGVSVTINGINEVTSKTEVELNCLLNEENGWTYTFTELPIYSDDYSTRIIYSVKETVDSHGNPIDERYTSQVSGTEEAGYTVTNVLNSASATLSIIDSETGLHLPGAEFVLYRVNEDTGEPEPFREDVIFTFEQPENDEYIYDDSAHTVTVTELPAGEYFFREITIPVDYTAPSPWTAFTVTEGNTDVQVVNNPTVRFTIEKNLTQASDVDESFVFVITNDSIENDKGSAVVITVPAGQLSASKKLCIAAEGSYTVKELGTNRFYRISADGCHANNTTAAHAGTSAFNDSIGGMQLYLNGSKADEKVYSFSNAPFAAGYLACSASVTNTMSKNNMG